MNSLGIALIWCVAQVTLAALAGGMVYLVARRAGHSAGRLAASMSLAVMLLLTVAACSPWPTWLPADAVAARDATESGAATSRGVREAPSDATPPPRRAGGVSPPKLSVGAAPSFWRTLWAELKSPPLTTNDEYASTARSWRWPAVAAELLLAVAAIGLLRLAFAGQALRRLARNSRPIDDVVVQKLVAELSRMIGLGEPGASARGNSELRPAYASRSPLHSPVAVKESVDLQTAATFGWRRPLILLPAAWRQWPRKELRAVLAHELAHLRSGDFATWVVAQFAVALHFYHPLVHWLAQRLRLEQELAADAAAADVAGGRTTYLESLAAHTLRADRLRPGWAAQTFLPTRSMFVRRIEMLKRTQTTASESLHGHARVGVIAVVAAIALVAIGIRGPQINAVQKATAEPSDEQPAGESPPDTFVPRSAMKPNDRAAFDAKADMWLIPDDAISCIRIRPAEVFRGDKLREAAEKLNEMLGETPSPFKMKVQEIETLIMTAPRPPSDERIVYRGVRPIGLDDFAQGWIKEAEEIAHPLQPFFHEKGKPNGKAYLQLGPHTIIFDSVRGIRKLLDRLEGGPKPPKWLGDATPSVDDQVWFAFNMDRFRRDARPQDPRNLFGGMPLQMVGPLLNETGRVVASAQIWPKLSIRAAASCKSADSAKRVQETAQAVVVMGRNMLSEQRRALLGRADGDDFVPLGLDVVEELLDAVEVSVSGTTVALEAKADRSGSEVLSTLLPAVHAARQAARRQQSINNLRQIALALLNYESAHGHLPPPVLYDEDTGTPYSWRVAILPFLEQQALYKQYRRNEPWDSPHNLKVLEFRPAQLISPTEQTSTNSAYFALVGPETVFAGKEGVKIRDIRDGMTKTLLVVEAKRDIPWTKPEDIPYSPDKPLPQLGAYSPGGFNAVFSDGHARFLSDDIEETTMRRLIEKSDGNRVELPARGPR